VNRDLINYRVMMAAAKILASGYELAMLGSLNKRAVERKEGDPESAVDYRCCSRHDALPAASFNDPGASVYRGTAVSPSLRPDLDIFDRVGGGDSFASGLITGSHGQSPEWAVNCGSRSRRGWQRWATPRSNRLAVVLG
jgi:sugar/nucleoside kinase (ribokinase family)